MNRTCSDKLHLHHNGDLAVGCDRLHIHQCLEKGERYFEILKRRPLEKLSFQIQKGYSEIQFN